MFNASLFKQEENTLLLEHLKGTNMRSPKSLKSYLGKRGLKLRFETRIRWGIYSGIELVGFLKKVV
jgi:hypothetical protein